MKLPPLFAWLLSSALGLGCSRSEDAGVSAQAEDDARQTGPAAEAPATPERTEQPLGERTRPPSDPAAPPATAEDPEPEADSKGSSRPAKRRAAATRDGARVRAGDGEGDGEGDKHAPEPGTTSVELTVKRLVIAANVVDREPVAPSNVISQATTDKVFAFVEVDNPKAAETELSVVFFPPTQPSFPVALTIGGLKRYRTWAYTRKLDEVGAWRVEVRRGDDVLATQSFQLTE